MKFYQICLILPSDVLTPWDSYYFQNEEAVIAAVSELSKQYPKQFTYKTLYPVNAFEAKVNNFTLGDK